ALDEVQQVERLAQDVHALVLGRLAVLVDADVALGDQLLQIVLLAGAEDVGGHVVGLEVDRPLGLLLGLVGRRGGGYRRGADGGGREPVGVRPLSGCWTGVAWAVASTVSIHTCRRWPKSFWSCSSSRKAASSVRVSRSISLLFSVTFLEVKTPFQTAWVLCRS